MNENATSGNNWSLNDGVIDFFGAKGKIFRAGKSWGINSFGGDIFVEVSPDTMMPQIQSCIEQDVAADNADNIAQVQLGPRQAVVFFLEGKLTVEHLKNATEDSQFIDIPGVAVDDLTVTVRVIAAPTYTVATADSDGKVIGERRGTYWSLTDGVIDFFGAKGKIFRAGKSWGTNAFGGDILVEVSPDTMMPEIRSCIEEDVAAGNADEIAQVQLGACQAVVFFLEGKLTVEHLKNATEESGFIDIPGVAVDDRTVTVRVLAEPTHTVATADTDGNVL